MKHHLFHRFGTLALIGAFALVGCDDSPTDPDPGTDPAQIEVNLTEVTLTEVGAPTQLTVTVLDANGNAIPGAPVIWSSSDESVATVTQEGLIEATGDGTATITATSGSVSQQIIVTVEITPPVPDQVQVTPAEVTLTSIGGTALLEATVLDEGGIEVPGAEVTWTSSDEEIVSVTEDGEIEAVAEGSATITAMSGEAAGMVEVTVTIADEVIVDPAEVTLAVGATAQLSATVLDLEGEEIPGATVTWTSSDEAVATVSGDGEVQAIAEGTATVSAVTGDAEGSAEVTVQAPAPVPAQVVVDPDEVTLTEVGATEQLSATVFDADETEIPEAEVTWSSSDEEVATVTEDGEVEAVADGVATITATSGEVEGTAEVTVEIEEEEEEEEETVVVE